MDNGFTLIVEYNGKQYDLEARFIRFGYIHQFHINIEGLQLIFEFDEERNYRIINPKGSNTTPLDKEFLQAIVQKVSSLNN